MALLEKVDFTWNVQEAKWLARYNELAAYVEINGLGSLPDYKGGRHLRWWAQAQRKQYKRRMNGESSSLSDKRKALLDELGFPWPDV